VNYIFVGALACSAGFVILALWLFLVMEAWLKWQHAAKFYITSWGLGFTSITVAFVALITDLIK